MALTAAICPTPDDLVAYFSRQLDDAAHRELEAHIAQCLRCQAALLDRQRAERADSAVSASRTAQWVADGETPDASLSETANFRDFEVKPPPKAIGRYPVRRLLGKGGFAEVYLCDRPLLEQPVAIKVPRRDKRHSQAALDDFVREAKTVARLKHPHIVQVFDADRLPDGTCYIVMEYVEGETLKDRLARGKEDDAAPRDRPTQQEAAELVAKVADAVHFANQKHGLVHRDLKPGNILLDEHGEPKVADFGLAMFEAEQRTHAGETAGTLGYMSPEQVRGEAHYLDSRSDIWSLGVMLYELLTGRPPFGRPDSPREEIIDEILHRDPKPPRQVDDGIAAGLERCALKCLSRDPGARYSTAADLAKELRSAVVDDFSPAVAPRLSVRPRPLFSRRAALMGGAAVAAGSAIAAATLWIRKAWLTPPASGRGENDDTLERGSTERDWARRLGQSPKELIWSGYRGTGSLRFNEELRAYEIVSDAVRLVRLGELPEGDMEFSVDVQRTGNPDGVGLFFGYHYGRALGLQANRFQVILLERQWEGAVDSYSVRHILAAVRPETATVMSEDEYGYTSVPFPDTESPTTLAVTLSDGLVQTVSWAGKECREIAGNERKHAIDAKARTGPWGLFHRFGSTWFTNPVLSPSPAETS